MKIWVDADACPVAIKEILCKAAIKRQITTTFVANQPIKTTPSPFLKSVQVASGFDVADNYIVQQIEADDVVITGDIPLAAEVVEKQGHVITPRGQKLDKENIKQRLTMRNFMEEMRSAGQITGGPSKQSQADRTAFANALDSLLTRLANKI
jgi:uncharacterized protein YaiI (UPF0178 family)